MRTCHLAEVTTFRAETLNFFRNLVGSWSISNAFVSGVGGPRFQSWTGQIGHNVANDSRSRSDISSKVAVLPRRNDAKMGPVNSLHASA